MIMKPTYETRPSDDFYNRSIQELAASLEERLGNADYDAVLDLCDQVYKTAYLDGVKDMLLLTSN